MSEADRRRLWTVLVGATLADTLLAPFYPQFFAGTFGADPWLAPGLYIAICRIAVALALPLWTRRARTVPPLRLVAWAQGTASVFGFASAFAPGLKTFFALSFLTEATRTGYLLLYGVLVETAPAEERGSTVARGAALMHGATLVSALVGGALLGHLGGRSAVVLAAAMDLVQLALLFRLARRAKGEPAVVEEKVQDASSAKAPLGLVAIAGVGFLSTFAVVLIRPHFTLFLQQRMPAASLSLLGAVFVVPSLAAVVAWAAMGKRWGGLSTPLGLALAAWGLVVTTWAQGASASLVALIVARAVYGVASYIVDVGVDHTALSAAEGALQRFGWVHAAQSSAIVVAPLVASFLAGAHGSRALFLAATGVAAAAACLATVVARPSSRPSLAAASASEEP